MEWGVTPARGHLCHSLALVLRSAIALFAHFFDAFDDACASVVAGFGVSLVAFATRFTETCFRVVAGKPWLYVILDTVRACLSIVGC